MERILRYLLAVIANQEAPVRKSAVFSAFLAILTLSVSACGKSMASSPTSPDAAVVATSSSATLAGTVGGGSGLGLSATTSGSTTGMTITVVGSGEKATVDAVGRFRLVITPSGNVQLRISGSGVDSTATVGTVTAGDTIEITIMVNGNAAEIENSDRATGQSREIEGRVEAIPPTTAAATFTVAGKTVATSSSTIFKMSGGSGTASFADVLLGARVHVKAVPGTGSVVTATEVNIQNQQTQLPVNLNGTISGFSGSASSFAFDIDGRRVIGGSFTDFNGNSAFADMANGKRAEVKAEYRLTPTQGLYATRIHVNK